MRGRERKKKEMMEEGKKKRKSEMFMKLDISRSDGSFNGINDHHLWALNELFRLFFAILRK